LAPNPKSPIPNPQSPPIILLYSIYVIKYELK
jgi:hypothetical protein